jgi:hypothetical protein
MFSVKKQKKLFKYNNIVLIYSFSFSLYDVVPYIIHYRFNRFSYSNRIKEKSA